MEQAYALDVVVPVAGRPDPLGELVGGLRAGGYTAAVLWAGADGASHADVVLLVDESGRPLRWALDGRPGFTPEPQAEFRRRAAARFGAGVAVGAELLDAEGETVRASQYLRSGVERAVLCTTALTPTTAAALATPQAEVVAARLGGRTVVVVHGRVAQELAAGVRAVPGVVLWRSATRRGVVVVGAGGRRARRVEGLGWDLEPVFVDPSSGASAPGEPRPADLLREVLAPPLDAPLAAEVLGLGPAAAQRLRILVRHSRSDGRTFAELAALAGLPGELAALADGRRDPMSLAGSRRVAAGGRSTSAAVRGAGSGAPTAPVSAGVPGLLEPTRSGAFFGGPAFGGPGRPGPVFARTPREGYASGEPAPGGRLARRARAAARRASPFLRPRWFRMATFAVAAAAVALTAADLAGGRPWEYLVAPAAVVAMWSRDWTSPVRLSRRG